MKRNIDLIRTILQAVENSPTGWAPSDMVVEGYDRVEVGYHALLAIEAGLVHGDDITSSGSGGPAGLITRLSWEGHEFLEASRDPNTWERAKQIAKKAGGVTLPLLTQILTKLLAGQLGL